MVSVVISVMVSVVVTVVITVTMVVSSETSVEREGVGERLAVPGLSQHTLTASQQD